jgi:hypothetical protein
MNKEIFKIEGPGIQRGIQEAASSRQSIGIVLTQDNKGFPVKVGYFFADTMWKFIKDSDIKSFTEDDDIRILLTYTTDQVPRISQASLTVDFTDKKESERRFPLMIPLNGTTNLLFRNVFRVKQNHVTNFTIQVETRHIIEKKKEPHIIVRYDCAHGSMHRHLFSSDGRNIQKKDLPTQKAENAIPFALEDIKIHLNEWLPQLGYPSLSPEILKSGRVPMELEKVKSKLLELYKHPELLNSTMSQYVQYVNVLR